MAAKRVASRCAQAALLLAGLGLARCGGKSDSLTSSGGSAQSGGLGGSAGGGDAGSPAMRGGSGGTITNGGEVTSGATATSGGTVGGGISVTSGGLRSTGGDAGAGGADDSCDPVALWQAIVRASVGFGTCEEAEVPTSPDRLRGAIVIDNAGRVVDNTGLSGDEKEAWLAMLSSRRWLCLADRSLGYKCRAAP
jgi:hypothetical protein